MLWVQSAHGKGIEGLAFSPDGKRLASVAGDGLAKTWDATSGDLLSSQGHNNALWSVEFDASGRRLLTNSRPVWPDADRRLFMLDSHSGELETSYNHFGRPVYGATFSPDGEQIASIGVDVVVVRNAQNGRVEQILDDGGSSPRDAECNPKYSPDGRWLATAKGGSVVLWDIKTGEIAKKFGGDHSLMFLRGFSPDSTETCCTRISRAWQLEV